MSSARDLIAAVHWLRLGHKQNDEHARELLPKVEAHLRCSHCGRRRGAISRTAATRATLPFGGVL